VDIILITWSGDDMKKLLVLFVTVVMIFTVAGCQVISNVLPNFSMLSTATPMLPTVVVPTLALPGIPNDNLGQTENVLVNLFKQINPGVVAIRVVTDQGGGEGTGFVFDTQGHIVTNYHVIENNTAIEVDFPSGLKVHGKVVGTDLDSDLAVIKVDVPAPQLKPLPMGDSDQLQVGQMVVAIGNPFGLSSTMTLGIISAKGRGLQSIRQTAEGKTFSAGDVIQTDASINPGNSGGPLLNLKGEVVGVNRAIRTTGATANGEPVNSGIGFAVSGNIVKRVVPVLISKGSYDYPYLGISALDEVSLILAEALGLPQSTGAYLVEVVKGGPADQAGLIAGTKDTSLPGLKSAGDLIIAIDNRPVLVYSDLIGYLMTQKSPGDKVILKILRDGKEMEVTITLGKRP
jgi:S1-C subfamily serine protease